MRAIEDVRRLPGEAACSTLWQRGDRVLARKLRIPGSSSIISTEARARFSP